MENKMFCYQCEQTAGCTGCTQSGVCGKSADTARLQDELTGALIGLARATESNPATQNTYQTIIEGLFTTITNVSFDDDAIIRQIEKQTDYLFIYNEHEIALDKRIAVSTRETTVAEILNRVLQGTGFSYTMEGNHIILVKSMEK